MKSFLEDPDTPDWFRRTVEREAERPGGTHDTGPGFARLMAAIQAPTDGGGSSSNEGPGGPATGTGGATGGGQPAGGASGPMVNGQGAVAGSAARGANVAYWLSALTIGGAVVVLILTIGKGDPPARPAHVAATTVRDDAHRESAEAPAATGDPLPLAPPGVPFGSVASARSPAQRASMSRPPVATVRPAQTASHCDLKEPDETRCVKEAGHMIAGDSAGALRILDSLDASGAKGLLREERDRYRVLALVAAGRIKEARELFAEFKRRHRDSPYVREMEEALRSGRAPALDPQDVKEGL